MNHRAHHIKEEWIVHPQKLAVACSPAEQTAQHIAPPLVGRQHPVTDHKDAGADVVGDDPQRDVALMAFAIVSSGDLTDLVGDIHHRVHVKKGVHILHDTGQPLQTHAGVDVLLLKLGVVALAVVFKLGENVVPHLDIPVALAAHGASRLAAAVLGATVIVDLGTGTAGTGSVLPEVVGLAEAEDPLGRDAHHLVPDLKGFLVLQVDGGIQPVRLQAYHFRQKLPGPGNGVLLEVVAEGEVAQHLKIGAVAVGLADVLNVAGADALLAGGHPVPGRLLLSGEPSLHGGHAAVNQQKACVVGRRDQREAGQPEVALALEVAEEHLPQLVESVVGMCHSVSSSYFHSISITMFSSSSMPRSLGLLNLVLCKECFSLSQHGLNNKYVILPPTTPPTMGIAFLKKKICFAILTLSLNIKAAPDPCQGRKTFHGTTLICPGGASHAIL